MEQRGYACHFLADIEQVHHGNCKRSAHFCAQIEVVFTDNSNTDHTLTADIKGTAWPIGKTVTYKISSSSINWTYTLAVSRPADFSYAGGTQQYSVTSYRQNTQGMKEAVRWTAQYSEDDGISWTDTQPDWLTAFTVSGNGGTTAQTYDATAIAQTGTDNSPHTTALQNAPARGSVDVPYNLANQTNGGSTDENTANCYAVSAPGYYSFPLVYGNAIKDGTANTSAYTSTAPSANNILSNFINHTGNAITDPYISKNADCTPAKAELVWQDEPSLVTDIKYNNRGNGNISFSVKKNTIRQGNAVIAIKDAGNNVLWSWHIWVTDEDINKTIEITNHQGYKYKMLSVNLGWCDANTVTYAERSCKVKFIAGKASQTITVKQASNSIKTGVNHPYYAWGRKDPFQPSNGLGDINKTWYDKDDASSTNNPAIEDFSTGITCIKNNILKPNVINGQYYGDDTYVNLWSANNNVYTNNDNPVVKTIYDPSPVGFKIPPSNAFTGFTTTGKDTEKISEINGTLNSSLNGWDFYTDSSKSKTIFFPISGFRDYEDGGRVEFIGVRGYCWLSVPFNRRGFVHILRYYPSLVYPVNSTHRSCGFGVRSSQE